MLNQGKTRLTWSVGWVSSKVWIYVLSMACEYDSKKIQKEVLKLFMNTHEPCLKDLETTIIHRISGGGSWLFDSVAVCRTWGKASLPRPQPWTGWSHDDKDHHHHHHHHHHHNHYHICIISFLKILLHILLFVYDTYMIYKRKVYNYIYIYV